MSMRRISISEQKVDEDKVVVTAKGLAGEEMEAELYQLHGFSSNPKGEHETLLAEINGDADNFQALPPSGQRMAKEGETLIYHGDTEISVTDKGVVITVGQGIIKVENGKLKTNMDIITTKDVIAGGVSLRSHTHIIPSGNTAMPTPTSTQGAII